MTRIPRHEKNEKEEKKTLQASRQEEVMRREDRVYVHLPQGRQIHAQSRVEVLLSQIDLFFRGKKLEKKTQTIALQEESDVEKKEEKTAETASSSLETEGQKGRQILEVSQRRQREARGLCMFSLFHSQTEAFFSCRGTTRNQGTETRKK